MGQRALLDGEVVRPFDVENGEMGELECISCQGGMHLVEQHYREDDAFIPRHFRHNPDNNERDCATGVGGGESTIHKKRKGWALSKAVLEFEWSERGEEKKIGDRTADAYIKFDGGHHRYGVGLAIEYQHKNKNKNRKAVTENYLDENHSVIWLWEDQYDGRDVDLFGGEVHTVWPDCVPTEDKWRVNYYREQKEKWVDAWKSGLAISGSPATLPPEWCDEQAQSIWKETEWKKIVSRNDYLVPITNGGEVVWPSEKYIEAVQSKYGDKEIEANIPSTIIEPLLWKQSEWQHLFDPPDEPRYRLQAAIPFVDSGRNNNIRFTEPICDEIRYNQSDWSALFSEKPLSNVPQPTVEIDLDVAPFLQRDFWLNAYQTGKKEESNQSGSPEQPPTPFDDVQCRFCGHFNYWQNVGDICQNCGEKYDWKWNIETGRISTSSVPDSVNLNS